MTTREHSDSARCWCNLLVIEPCLQCNPFDDYEDDVKRESAIISAVAMKMTIMDVTAARPKKSKGCWKCGGDGIFKVTDKQIKRDAAGRQRFVFHRNSAES